MPDTASGTTLAPEAWRQDGGDVVLLATQCGRCGERTFPPVPACPRCWERDDVRTAPLPRHGTVHAFTVTRIPADGINAPYAVAYVDLVDGPRVCGRLREWDGVRIGDRVEPVAGVLREGSAGTLHGWLFAPVHREPR